MKKALAYIYITLLLLAGCRTNAVESEVLSNNVYDNVYKTENECDTVKIPGPLGTDEPLKDDGDVEKNINADQLSEDRELTKEAEEKNVTESDVIVDQEGIKSEKDNLVSDEETILKTFESKVPKEVVMNIKYNKYEVPTDYLLILSSEINIREKPSTSSKVIGCAHYFEKVNLIAEVQGEFIAKYNTDKWYKIALKVGGKVQNGYILSNLAEPRGFQFNKMFEAVKRAKSEMESNTSAYITNYKNRVGLAPLYNGSTKDKFGILRNQSAPAYYEPNLGANFRYITDGTLVSTLAETDSFYKIRTLNFDGEYYVPKKYLSFRKTIKELTKVVVVDRKNQNEGVFELIDGKWNLISYIYATTGENSKHKLPTDLGYYMAIQKVEKFSYLDDVTKQIAGYAPYAIRFNGGAYIHGVPVDYVLKDGKRVDPGIQEYLFTVGTVPRSHKCVRNYTSHSKFLYDWIEIGKSAVIVIE
ncbi:L,D-transpeptidase family protein [Acetivibrio cellulolyticus]|uniref:L,D-transpeptidase family protein n=1 Tax=Acetivibrio cellulolyticus TaxID=35830 RepID=UPI0001E301BE|nr:L,D-transpeptidase family protein [Acetivibrio cellulolyticus]